MSEYNNIFIRERDDLGRMELATKKALEKGMEDGIEIGSLKEKTKGIAKAIIQNKLSINEIAEIFQVSIQFVLDVKNKK